MSEDHRHDWQPSKREEDPHPWRCAECRETSATCVVCEKASGRALLICERCLRRERYVLDTIGRLDAMFDPFGRSGGGFRLVTVSGTGIGAPAQQPHTVEARLLGWVARWSEASPNTESLDALDYLRSRILWAVHNATQSDWDTYRQDVRRIRATALAGAGLAPEELPFKCGFCRIGKLVQDRVDYKFTAHDDGLQDEVRCTGCHTRWPSREEARFATRQLIHDLPDREPDALVTIEQARKIFTYVPTETIRSWVKRDRRDHERSIRETDAWDDKWSAWEEAGNIGPIPEPPPFYDRMLPERGRRKGRSLYRLADLDAYATRRTSQDRRGRRAG